MALVTCGDCGETDLSRGDFDGQWYCVSCWASYDHQRWGTGFLKRAGASLDVIGLPTFICEPGIRIFSSLLHGKGGPF
jgi:hypothetical protein